MATKIRLARKGSKKRPFYRVVVVSSTSPRDGKFIEILGHYNPLLPKDHSERFILKKERVEYWLGQGAWPTDRVAKFIELSNISSPLAEKLKKRKISPRKVVEIKSEDVKSS